MGSIIIVLVVATTALSGVATGASLDVSIRQLPARHRMGVMAYSVYSQATDLGTARIALPSIEPAWALRLATCAWQSWCNAWLRRRWQGSSSPPIR